MPLPPKGKFITPSVDAIFIENVTQLVADAGRNIKIHKQPLIEDCPSCGFDSIRKRSNNIYNEANPNPLGPLNIPFINGRRCPVCKGKGKLQTPQNETIIGVIITDSDKLRQLEQTQGKRLNSLVETIVLVEHLDTLKVAKSATIDSFICEKISEPTTMGLTAEGQAFIKVIWHRSSQ